MHADFFKLAWASLGEPLQTLSELVVIFMVTDAILLVSTYSWLAHAPSYYTLLVSTQSWLAHTPGIMGVGRQFNMVGHLLDRADSSWGEPKRAPHLRVSRLPAYASGVDIYIYVYIPYLGQQFGQRFRCLARSFVSLKDRNTFKDVRDVQRKTWMPFSRRAMRLFVHVDVSFD